MRRAPFVAAGTIAGIAAVLAFPVEKPTVHAAGTGAAATTTTTESPTAASGTASSTTTSDPTAPRRATGDEEDYPYGQLAVRVTVEGARITGVTLANLTESDPRSEAIDSDAVPQLEREVIDAGSADVDGVSGATFTSEAFLDSLSSALDKLGWR